jgi:hypothetical protein
MIAAVLFGKGNQFAIGSAPIIGKRLAGKVDLINKTVNRHGLRIKPASAIGPREKSNVLLDLDKGSGEKKIGARVFFRVRFARAMVLPSGKRAVPLGRFGLKPASLAASGADRVGLIEQGAQLFNIDAHRLARARPGALARIGNDNMISADFKAREMVCEFGGGFFEGHILRNFLTVGGRALLTRIKPASTGKFAGSAKF